jgi:hypothetical protein
MTKSKSKSKMIKALRKWRNKPRKDRQYKNSLYVFTDMDKHQIVGLFNEAIATRGK